jgi:hypothetical protein
MPNPTTLNDLRRQLVAAMDAYKAAYPGLDDDQRKNLEQHYRWHQRILASLRYA